LKLCGANQSSPRRRKRHPDCSRLFHAQVCRFPAKNLFGSGDVLRLRSVPGNGKTRRAPPYSLALTRVPLHHGSREVSTRGARRRCACELSGDVLEVTGIDRGRFQLNSTAPSLSRGCAISSVDRTEGGPNCLNRSAFIVSSFILCWNWHRRPKQYGARIAIRTRERKTRNDVPPCVGAGRFGRGNPTENRVSALRASISSRQSRSGNCVGTPIENAETCPNLPNGLR
jgi:hypothetical protein